jgi:hypothetical protein
MDQQQVNAACRQYDFLLVLLNVSVAAVLGHDVMQGV